MSWPIAAFTVLAAGLLAGFAWYERTKPDSRMVALVGTLAAFAAIGRIAFAALPNVKPTTDIVLVAGYALGGAPGYVVGAVAALSSNFFFGQGPWTPWQMIGWGATGVLGAVLARMTRGRIGRLPLALFSFVIGFGFTALQDLGDWVTYSDHSLGQLGVYLGKGAGFDLVHASGCFAFALLFGPSLIRTLQRFKTRTQVTWLAREAPATLPLVALVLISVTLGASRGAARAAVVRGSPVAYLLSAQNRDGGFAMTPGDPSDLMVTGWAAMAIADSAPGSSKQIAGHDRRAYGYLAATRGSERGAGAIERTLLAAGAVGPVRGAEFAGMRERLIRLVEPDGSIGGQVNLTAFGILALRATGLQVPSRSVGWLVAQQDRDGGFNFDTRGGASDADDTGAVLSALAGTGRRQVTGRAVAFLRHQLNRDGGFGDQPGAASNAQSTAFAISGLIAAGIDPGTVRRAGSRSPVTYLESLIQPGGAVDYSAGDAQTPVWVTAEAEVALSGHAL